MIVWNVLVGVALLIFMISILFSSGYAGRMYSGVNVGYGAAVITWLSFIFSFAAFIVLAIFGLMSFRGKQPVDVIKRNKKFFFLILVAILAALFAVQFGTNLLIPIESGVADGVAPPVLMMISSLLSVFCISSILIYIMSSQRPMAGPASLANGGQTEASITAQQPLILGNAKQSESSFTPTSTPISQPSLHSEKQIQEQKVVEQLSEHKPKDEEVLKRLSEIVWPNEPANQSTSVTSTMNQSEKDALQTRKNIAEWILLSLRIGGKVAKSKLELNFEDQFPKVYVPLFNSVLYDLIYQGKVESIKEGARMMLSLAKDEAK